MSDLVRRDILITRLICRDDCPTVYGVYRIIFHVLILIKEDSKSYHKSHKESHEYRNENGLRELIKMNFTKKS